MPEIAPTSVVTETAAPVPVPVGSVTSTTGVEV